MKDFTNYIDERMPEAKYHQFFSHIKSKEIDSTTFSFCQNPITLNDKPNTKEILDNIFLTQFKQKVLEEHQKLLSNQFVQQYQQLLSSSFGDGLENFETLAEVNAWNIFESQEFRNQEHLLKK